MFNLENVSVLAYNKPVDMRNSFNGLVSIVKRVLKLEPVSDKMFLFFNRRRNYIKVLYWDRTGYCLISKKLESGRVGLPGFEDLQLINKEQLKLIFDGINLSIGK
jgi:transposase